MRCIALDPGAAAARRGALCRAGLYLVARTVCVPQRLLTATQELGVRRGRRTRRRRRAVHALTRPTAAVVEGTGGKARSRPATVREPWARSSYDDDELYDRLSCASRASVRDARRQRAYAHDEMRAGDARRRGVRRSTLWLVALHRRARLSGQLEMVRGHGLRRELRRAHCGRGCSAYFVKRRGAVGQSARLPARRALVRFALSARRSTRWRGAGSRASFARPQRNSQFHRHRVPPVLDVRLSRHLVRRTRTPRSGGSGRLDSFRSRTTTRIIATDQQRSQRLLRRGDLSLPNPLDPVVRPALGSVGRRCSRGANATRATR